MEDEEGKQQTRKEKHKKLKYNVSNPENYDPT